MESVCPKYMTRIPRFSEPHEIVEKKLYDLAYIHSIVFISFEIRRHVAIISVWSYKDLIKEE